MQQQDHAETQPQPPPPRVAYLRLHFDFLCRVLLAMAAAGGGGNVGGRGGGDLRGGQRLCELAAHKRAASLFAALKEFSKSCRINIRQFGSLTASPPYPPILWSGIRSSSHAVAGSGRLVLARSKAEQEGIGFFFCSFFQDLSWNSLKMGRERFHFHFQALADASPSRLL